LQINCRPFTTLERNFFSKLVRAVEGSRKSFECNNSREETFANSLEAAAVIATTIGSFHNFNFFSKRNRKTTEKQTDESTNYA
jgi:hypothetical protein